MPVNVFEQMDATSDIVCIRELGCSSQLSKLHVVWSAQLNMSVDILYPGLFAECFMAKTSCSILFSKLQSWP